MLTIVVSALTRRRLFLGAILLLANCVVAAAQIRSVTDGHTPLGLAPGAPAGSYELSGFENVNPYNGGLNFSLPITEVSGRGGASYTIRVPIENKWRAEVDDFCDPDRTVLALRVTDLWVMGIFQSVRPWRTRRSKSRDRRSTTKYWLSLLPRHIFQNNHQADFYSPRRNRV